MNTLRTARIVILLMSSITGAAENACPVRLRVHNFTVNPSTGPVSEMTATNLTNVPVRAELRAHYPAGWVVAPATQKLSLAPGESTVLSLAIEKAMDSIENIYPMTLDILVGEDHYTHTQHLVCASTPYYRPAIDGDLSEWNDAIPVSMTTRDKTTVVRSYWNKKQFCLGVDVQEDALTDHDALQFALAPGKSKTPTSHEAKSTRYEFVVTGREGGTCYQLLSPGDLLTQVSDARDLNAFPAKDATVRVVRKGQITHYELALNLRAMRALRATAGREYCFSLLVHDPTGTGLRDLGSIMRLHPAESDLAWSNWKGARWPLKKPLDNKVEFGFCSSIH
ncbi:MAG: hypothetical protein GY809_04200 [Planctomycetes bacterium]|nr:hypothetical protein [Planctomycetota bacterium]